MSVPILEKSHIDLAVSRISKTGDTDIFPHVSQIDDLRNNPHKYIEEITHLDRNFHETFSKLNSTSIKCLVPHNSTFRIATKIDLTLTIYYLSLMIQVFEQVNPRRSQISWNVVYSHWYQPDINNGFLFASKSNWKCFKKDSAVMLQEAHNVIIGADIQSFYESISFGVIEKTLNTLSIEQEVISRILVLLKSFQGDGMKGLPIGGDSSRLLSELVLMNVDEQLTNNGIEYKRYVDDFHILAESESEIYEQLNTVAKVLYNNTGLLLNSNKISHWNYGSYQKHIDGIFNFQQKDSTNPHIQKYFDLRSAFDNYAINEPINDFTSSKQSELYELLIHHTTKELSHNQINLSMAKIILNALKVTDSNTTEQVLNKFISDIEKSKSIFNFIIKAIIVNADKISSESLYSFYNQLNSFYLYDGTTFANEFNIGNFILFLKLIKSDETDKTVQMLGRKHYDSKYIKFCACEYNGKNTKIINL